MKFAAARAHQASVTVFLTVLTVACKHILQAGKIRVQLKSVTRQSRNCVTLLGCEQSHFRHASRHKCLGFFDGCLSNFHGHMASFIADCGRLCNDWRGRLKEQVQRADVIKVSMFRNDVLLNRWHSLCETERQNIQNRKYWNSWCLIVCRWVVWPVWCFFFSKKFWLTFSLLVIEKVTCKIMFSSQKSSNFNCESLVLRVLHELIMHGVWQFRYWVTLIARMCVFYRYRFCEQCFICRCVDV